MLKVKNGRAMFYRCDALEDVQADFPALSDGDLMFTDCILNKESVIRICNSLPVYTSGTHKITFGIHVDHKTDSDMLNAIANAESKRWTVTAQWNGTAGTSTASTFGLRKPTIYAKVIEWNQADGAMKRAIDWGHYVSNWEKNGYVEFANVEEAREYFGLPEDEFLTEGV